MLSQPIQRFISAWWRALLGLAMLGSLVATGFLVSSCSTVTRSVVIPTEIEGATYVGNKVCSDCHAKHTRTFASSPHYRAHIPGAQAAGGTSCESCHGPGSKHVQGGGGRGKFIVNPGKNVDACFQCHQETHAEFNLPQHHPVLENKMNCAQCHDPHGADIFKPSGGLALGRKNETCAQCHREQSKMVIYEHEAMREGCTICHAAHGSINSKMLVQRDNNLCLKCHAQVPAVSGEIFIGETPHTALLSRGSCWSSGCHTAVHGSNIDRQLRY